MLLNHYLYFRYFSTPPPRHSQEGPTFTEIAACFGICVWLVPFALFVSLSAGEMVLPSMGSEWATGAAGGVGGYGGVGGGGGGVYGGGGEGRGRRAKGLVKEVIERAGAWVAGVVEGVGWGRGEGGGRRDRRAL